MGSYISISNQSYRTSGGGQCQAEIKRPKRFYTPLAWSWSWPWKHSKIRAGSTRLRQLSPARSTVALLHPKKSGVWTWMAWDGKDETLRGRLDIAGWVLRYSCYARSIACFGARCDGGLVIEGPPPVQHHHQQDKKDGRGSREACNSTVLAGLCGSSPLSGQV